MTAQPKTDWFEGVVRAIRHTFQPRYRAEISQPAPKLQRISDVLARTGREPHQSD